jgi:hypothetical protein
VHSATDPSPGATYTFVPGVDDGEILQVVHNSRGQGTDEAWYSVGSATDPTTTRTWEFDAVGRPVAFEDSDGTRSEVLARWRTGAPATIRQTDGSGSETWRMERRDGRGRLLAEATFGGRSSEAVDPVLTEFEYGTGASAPLVGLTFVEADDSGETWLEAAEYDAWGRPTQLTDRWADWGYTYDGDRVLLTYAEPHDTGYEPLAQAFAYDAASRLRGLLTQTNGQQIAMETLRYDSFGRIAEEFLAVADPSSDDANAATARVANYDAHGRLSSTRATSSLPYGDFYEVMQAPTRATPADPPSLSASWSTRLYERTASGRIESFGAPSVPAEWESTSAAGATPTSINNDPLTWDARGRLTSFDTLLDATWHDDGRLHEITVDVGGAELTERRHYDPVGNPVLIEWRDANGQLVEWERRVYVGSLLVQQRYNSGWWRRFMWNGVDPRPYGIETGCAPDLLGRPFDGAEPGDGCAPKRFMWRDARDAVLEPLQVRRFCTPASCVRVSKLRP